MINLLWLLSLLLLLCYMYFHGLNSYQSSYVPWLRNSKFLHDLEYHDSVDSEIIDEELRAIQLDAAPTTCVLQLAACVNYADLNNSVLRMPSRVSAIFSL